MRLRTLAAFLVLVMAGGSATANPSEWRAEGWARTDFSKTNVPFGEIMSGGPPRDGIPPIDRPRFRPVAEITDLPAAEPVIGLEVGGEARAYPLRILIWHEIVNDVVSDRHVAVTYCPLCNAALVFDRRMGERVLDFGTTGKLRKSDLVMYDRQTESWWQQFTGEAIVGALAGATLKMIPARLESFGEFRTRHPSGKVLVPNDPSARRYGTNPYVGYDSAAAPFLYRGEMPPGIDPMARVIVVRDGGKAALIVALDHVRRRGPLRIGAFELRWSAGQNSAVDTARIAEGRDVGTVIADRVDDRGVRSPAVYDVTFAFVAHAFHPETAIIKE